MSVTASDWVKGISLSIMASIIGGGSKLAIRKSWLMELSLTETPDDCSSNMANGLVIMDNTNSSSSSSSSVRQAFPDNNNSNKKKKKKERTLCWAHFLRFLGMVGMTFLNPLCGVLAMNYASPSILAPFSGLTLVWIVLFSKHLIDEEPSRSQIVAAGLIVLGEVVVAIFGDHTNEDGATLTSLTQSYRKPLFVLYLVGIVLWMFLLFYWMLRAQDAMTRRFAWGVSGGSITGLQNFLKDSLTILRVTQEDGASLPWYTWIMVILAIGTAFGGLLFLTACMKRYDATYSSAMFVGSFVVSASVMSAIHYDTFQHLQSLWNFVLYPAGLVILMTGVYILVVETKETDASGVELSRRSNAAPLVRRDKSNISTMI